MPKKRSTIFLRPIHSNFDLYAIGIWINCTKTGFTITVRAILRCYTAKSIFKLVFQNINILSEYSPQLWQVSHFVFIKISMVFAEWKHTLKYLPLEMIELDWRRFPERFQRSPTFKTGTALASVCYVLLHSSNQTSLDTKSDSYRIYERWYSILKQTE